MTGKGYVHVYTGDGKGKTTSAVGLAVRALGQGLKVFYAYFHKNPEKYGYTEIENLKKLGAEILGFAKYHPFCDKDISRDEIVFQVNAGLEIPKKIMQNKKIDMLILDEILISVRDGFLEEKILIDFIQKRPEHIELVLTGRGASKNIRDVADYVSNISKVKHPYDKKITGRKGIEY